MPDNINEKIKEQYDHDNSGGSLNTNLGDFLDSESASGDSINTQWRNWAEGTGTSLNTRLFHKHGGSGSFMTRWKNWIAFSSTHSFNFDGSNDYLDISHSISSFTSDTNATISAWIYPSNTSNYKAIFTFGDTNGNTFIHFQLTDAEILTCGVRSGGSDKWVLNTDSAIQTGVWTHVAVTQNGTSPVLYVNGTAVAQTFSVTTDKTFWLNSLSGIDNAHIGFSSYNNNLVSYFNGLIDEVAIWDVALSSSDITSIYNNGKVIDLSKSASYGVDRTGNLKLWLRCGDKSEPESTTAIARQDFYTDFDGTDDHIEIKDADMFSFGDGSSDSPFSVNAWVYFNSTASAVVLQKGTAFASSEYSIGTDANSKMYFHLLDDGGSGTGYLGRKYNTALSTGEWYHFGATYDGSTNNSGVKLYLNGIRVDDTDAEGGTYTAMGNLSGDAFIGRNDTSYSNFRMSNLSLHKTELDAQTISQMAKSRFTPMRDNRFSVVDFDGTDDKITFTRQVFTGAFTISWWFNGDTQTFYQRMFNDSTSANNNILTKDANGLVTIRINGTYRANISGVPHNEWCHLAFTRDGSGNIKSYLNGVASGTSTDTDEFALDFIGEQVVCSMASVSMYNVEKSAEEIYAIYQKGITYNESSESGLVGYWRMGDDTSKAYPTIADSSSNSNDGTMTNMTSDDIVQQMVAGYDLGAFESSSEELGVEKITNGTFDSDIAGWSNSHPSRGDVTFSNNRLRIDNTTGTGATIAQFTTPFTSGKVYKVSFDYYHISGSTATVMQVFFDLTDMVSVSITSGQTTTFYMIPSANRSKFSLGYFGGGDVYELDNISVKEVLQSEVSDTYPAIIDVNEPVLGAELITSNTTSDWTPYGSNDVNTTTNGVSVTNSDSDARGAYYQISGLTNGSLYKVVFNARSSNLDGNLKTYFNASTTYFSPVISTTDTQYTIYGIAGSFNTLSIFALDPDNTIFIENFSVKEVLGNVGTMTNQATSDLVYSSVLPDQSFLTGVNSAYNFIDLDGSDEAIIGGSIGISGDATFSISFWAYWDNSSWSTSYPSVVGNSTYSTGVGLSTTFNNGKPALDFYNVRFIADSALNVRQWYHIAFTKTSGNVSSTSKIYVNGEEVAGSLEGSDQTPNITNSNVRIGHLQTAIHYWNGYVGQTAIWNKKLSSTEISAIYTAGRHSNLLDSYSDNLVGYWAMSALDGKTGLSDVGDGTIYDRSGNSNHGTATNTESADLKSSPNAESNGYAKGDTNRSTTTP